MNKEKYLSDLKDIRDIMQKSTKFISLSGLSGIMAGVYALIASIIAYYSFYDNDNRLNNFFTYRKVYLTNKTLSFFLIIGCITLILAIGTALVLTRIKAKKNKQKLWDKQSQRLIFNLSVPLITGGIICLILIFKGYIGFVPPFTLVFYGLALVNAANFTLKEVRSLGILEVILGIFSFQFIGYGLFFWAIGFGILHIIYGIVMEVRYKK